MSADCVRHEYSALVAPDLDSLVQVVTPAHDKLSFCISTFVRCLLTGTVAGLRCQIRKECEVLIVQSTRVRGHVSADIQF